MNKDLFLGIKMSEEAEASNHNYLRGLLYFSKEILNLYPEIPLVELLRLRNSLTDFKHLTRRDEENTTNEEEENVIRDILDFVTDVINKINKTAEALNMNAPNQTEIMHGCITFFKTILKKVLISVSTASFADYDNWPQYIKNFIEA